MAMRLRASGMPESSESRLPSVTIPFARTWELSAPAHGAKRKAPPKRGWDRRRQNWGALFDKFQGRGRGRLRRFVLFGASGLLVCFKPPIFVRNRLPAEMAAEAPRTESPATKTRLLGGNPGLSADANCCHNAVRLNFAVKLTTRCICECRVLSREVGITSAESDRI